MRQGLRNRKNLRYLREGRKCLDRRKLIRNHKNRTNRSHKRMSNNSSSIWAWLSIKGMTLINDEMIFLL